MDIKLKLSYEEAQAGLKLLTKARALLEEGRPELVGALTIDYWDNCSESDSTATFSYLAEHGARLSGLHTLFIGDMYPEECEASWLKLCDLAPLIMALPQLQYLKVEGSQGLRLSNLKHNRLRRLIIRCDALKRETILDITRARLTALEMLELYLGSEEQGFDASIEELKLFMEQKHFPALTDLALLNSGITDEIARELVKSPILEQLEKLDLSRGTLSDKGMELLLKCEALKKLTSLSLSHNYLSYEMMKRVEKELPFAYLGLMNGEAERLPEVWERKDLYDGEIE